MGQRGTPRNPCSVCASGLAAKVNQALADGVSLRLIEAQTGCTKSSIHRHKQEHYVAAMARGHKRTEAYNRAIAEVEEAAEAFNRDPQAFGPAPHKPQPIEAELVDEAQDEAESQQEAPSQPRQALPSPVASIPSRSPVRDREDLAGRAYGHYAAQAEVAHSETAYYKEAPSPGRARSAISAHAEAAKTLTLIGRALGIVTDAPTQDNRTINLHGYSTEDIRSMLASLKGEAEALPG